MYDVRCTYNTIQYAMALQQQTTKFVLFLEFYLYIHSV